MYVVNMLFINNCVHMLFIMCVVYILMCINVCIISCLWHNIHEYPIAIFITV